MATGKAAEPQTFKDRLAAAFGYAEDAIYVGLALLLALTAFTLLVSEFVYFVGYVSAGTLVRNVVSLLDRILLVIILVEVLYTVMVSFAQHILRAEPFLIVGMIAVIRRVLVLTAEMQQLLKENQSMFYNAMVELGLLTILIIVLVASLRLLTPATPAAQAAQEKSLEKPG
jgi:uncharacterized membrane protein (DUF373 family)